MKDIKLPMSAEDAKSLKLGEMVTVSGMLFTGRSRFHIRAAENDIYPAIDYDKINCFLLINNTSLVSLHFTTFYHLFQLSKKPANFLLVN